MPECPSDCLIESIPARLHTTVRKDGVVEVRSFQQVKDSDRLFMRHLPLPVGEPYGFGGAKIPTHDHLADQSVNSELINVPDGCACDVLFNTKDGNYFSNYQIACFAVNEIRALKTPNPNTTIIKDRFNNSVQPTDVFTFDVIHSPTPCMYPHCVIRAMKNEKPIENKQVSDGMKTLLRAKFAELAECRRLEMERLGPSSQPTCPNP